jgi:hypothetical protein
MRRFGSSTPVSAPTRTLSPAEVLAVGGAMGNGCGLSCGGVASLVESWLSGLADRGCVSDRGVGW